MSFLNTIARITLGSSYPLSSRLIFSQLKETITVFVFHEITNTPSLFQSHSSISMEWNKFLRSVKWIKQHFHCISINSLLLPKTDIDKPLALITFDDAWKGTQRAIDFLTQELNLPVILFTNMGTLEYKVDFSALMKYAPTRLGEVTSFEKLTDLHKEFAMNDNFLSFQGAIMEESEISTLARNQNVTVSNHGFYHLRASDFSHDVFMTNFQRNVLAIKDIGGSTDYFAFPYGVPKRDFYDSHIRDLVENNVSVIFSTCQEQNRPPLIDSVFGRLTINNSHSRYYDFLNCVTRPILRRS